MVSLVEKLKFQEWSISISDDFPNVNEHILINLIRNKTNCIYLLDAKKESFDFLEKFIFDVALHHFKNMNLIFDSNKHSIEFWIKTGFNSKPLLHLDCDENLRKRHDVGSTPLLSTITYLNESKCPLIVTNISEEQAKADKLIYDDEILISFPQTMKHVSFTGGDNYHGAVNVLDRDEMRYVIIIGIWDKPLLDVPFYISFSYNSHVLIPLGCFPNASLTSKTEANLVLFSKTNNVHKTLVYCKKRFEFKPCNSVFKYTIEFKDDFIDIIKHIASNCNFMETIHCILRPPSNIFYKDKSITR